MTAPLKVQARVQRNGVVRVSAGGDDVATALPQIAWIKDGDPDSVDKITTIPESTIRDLLEDIPLLCDAEIEWVYA